MIEKVKHGKPSTFKRSPRHQNHAKMNAHILGNAMVVQKQNDQKVVNHVIVKAQQKWDKLVTIVKNVHHSQNQFWSN